jgi:hypothetical protein
MASRAAYLEDLRSPRRLDLLGLLDGAPVGTGFVEPHGDDLAGDGPEGWISVRVLQRHLVAASAPNCSGLYRLALVPTVEARSRCR